MKLYWCDEHERYEAVESCCGHEAFMTRGIKPEIITAKMIAPLKVNACAGCPGAKDIVLPAIRMAS